MDIFKHYTYPSRIGYPASPSVKPRPRGAAAVLKTGISKRLLYTYQWQPIRFS